MGQKMQQRSRDEVLGPHQLAMAGGFSGVMTTIVMAPGERIKCLLQVGCTLTDSCQFVRNLKAEDKSESEPDICVSSLQPTVILMISVFSQLKLTPGTTHPSQLRRGIREFVFLLPRIIFPELCEGCCELRLVFLSAVRTQNSPSYVW